MNIHKVGDMAAFVLGLADVILQNLGVVFGWQHASWGAFIIYNVTGLLLAWGGFSQWSKENTGEAEDERQAAWARRYLAARDAGDFEKAERIKVKWDRARERAHRPGLDAKSRGANE